MSSSSTPLFRKIASPLLTMSFIVSSGDDGNQIKDDKQTQLVNEIKKLEIEVEELENNLKNILRDQDKQNIFDELLEKNEEIEAKTRTFLRNRSKACPIGFTPVNSKGTCMIDSCIFAFLYPPSIREPFMKKVLIKKEKAEADKAEHAKAAFEKIEKIAKTFEIQLPRESHGQGEEKGPELPCLSGLLSFVLGEWHSTFYNMMHAFAEKFDIFIFDSVVHMKSNEYTTDIVIVKHNKTEEVLIEWNLELGSRVKTFKLRSIVLGLVNDNYAGHAMAVASCSDLDVINEEVRWHFYNGQDPDMFAQGRQKDFLKSFTYDYTKMSPTGDMGDHGGQEDVKPRFGMTLYGVPLNLYDRRVSGYLIYVTDPRKNETGKSDETGL